MLNNIRNGFLEYISSLSDFEEVNTVNGCFKSTFSSNVPACFEATVLEPL